MFTEKKFAVYYRQLPSVLSSHLNRDSFIKHAKDGVKTYEEGHNCPRLSVIIEPCGNHDQDKERVKKLEALLLELQANNQIIGYSG